MQRLFKKAYLSPLERDFQAKVSLSDSCLLISFKYSTFVTNQTITDPHVCFSQQNSQPPNRLETIYFLRIFFAYGTVESTDTIAKLKTKIENSSTFESDPDFVKTLIQNCIDERVSRNEREAEKKERERCASRRYLLHIIVKLIC
ncbi:hypothetical protein TNCV_2082111 [Trichonephila clavipes]|nr:hypothetical protein TNCV_2082111 [Trichonephila clavipes]